MRSGQLLSIVATALLANVVGGCAQVTAPTLLPDGGRAGNGGVGGPDARTGVDAIVIVTTNWANSTGDDGEQRDGGNRTAGAGCSAICQIPAGWSCSGLTSVCTMAGVCGDSILVASEVCDDGNTTSGDG